MYISGPPCGVACLIRAGDTGCATVLTGRDHGEDNRQPSFRRGQARGETGRTRLR